MARSLIANEGIAEGVPLPCPSCGRKSRCAGMPEFGPLMEKFIDTMKELEKLGRVSKYLSTYV